MAVPNAPKSTFGGTAIDKEDSHFQIGKNGIPFLSFFDGFDFPRSESRSDTAFRLLLLSHLMLS